MVLNLLISEGIEIGSDLFQILPRNGGIHQSTRGAAYQPVTDIYDMDGYQDGDDRVDHEPPGVPHDHDSRDYPHGGPHVGQQMPPVRFKQERSPFFPDPDQDKSHSPVNHRGQEGEEQTGMDIINGVRIHKAGHGLRYTSL